MKIILDTNIWLDLFDNRNLLDGLEQSLISTTFLNYFELIKKKRIVTDVEKFRWVFNKMDEFQKNFDPPFVHIAKQHQFFHYNVLMKLRGLFDFLSNYKNGTIIVEENIKAFYDYIDEVNQDFQNLSTSYNFEAKQIQAQIKNRSKHLKRETITLIEKYIANIVDLITGQDIKSMDFSKIELLVKTLDLFFKKLEVGDIVSVTNDILDFFILSYVQPEDLYVTKDKKWKTLIIDSGCEKYLLPL